jgi:hypothetical protein
MKDPATAPPPATDGFNYLNWIPDLAGPKIPREGSWAYELKLRRGFKKHARKAHQALEEVCTLIESQVERPTAG